MNDDVTVPQFSSILSSLKRFRASCMPPLPTDIDDVNIEGPWSTTWSDKPILSHIDNDWGVLIFATKKNLRRLSKCKTVYIDGTFKSCPKPYTQFVTIHGDYFGRVLPFAMCLCTGKTTGHYSQFLQHISARIRIITRRRFSPRLAICDFEVALISALPTELPRTAVQGCYFHFCQALWRKIQNLGLATAYKQSERLQKCVRKIMALGYIQLPVVRNTFNMFTQSRSTLKCTRRHPELNSFITYFRDNYIMGVFEPALWNVHTRNNDTRTNNHVEAFHHKCNKAVGRAHPSIWLFIRKLKDEQQMAENTASAADRGEPKPKKRKKWRELYKRIRLLKSEYEHGSRSLDDY